MKILVVTHYFWPESFRINDLATHFANAGNEVTVLTGLPNYPEGHLNPDYKNDPHSFVQYGSVKVCRIPHVLRGSTKISLVLNYFSFLTSASILGAWKLRKTNFDVVFVFAVSPITVAIPAIMIGRLKRAPIFLWVQDLWPETLSAVGIVRSSRLLALVGGLVRWIYARCDHILIQSQAFASSIRKYSPEADQPGKMLYLPNWAEEVFGQVSQVTQNAVTRREGLFTVMFAGNIGEAQDFPALLDAAELLKSNDRIRWIIVGDGRMREWVSSEVTRRRLTDCFRLVGRFPMETMPDFFKCADALLVSLKANEIFSQTVPGKVQSYLASGKPVVGMLDGEARAVIEKSAGGKACGSGDSENLAKIIEELAKASPGELAQMGENGRQYYEQQFERGALFARLEGYFQAAIEGKPLSDASDATTKSSTQS